MTRRIRHAIATLISLVLLVGFGAPSFASATPDPASEARAQVIAALPTAPVIVPGLPFSPINVLACFGKDLVETGSVIFESVPLDQLGGPVSLTRR